MKQKYTDILGIIIFGISSIVMIYKLEKYAWMFVNEKIKVNAEILNYKNYEGGGYSWSIISIKYQIKSNDYRPNAFSNYEHISNNQTHIISYVNKNNPFQVCTKNNLFDFMVKLFIFFTFIIILFFLTKKNYCFIKRMLIVSSVKIKRKFSLLVGSPSSKHILLNTKYKFKRIFFLVVLLVLLSLIFNVIFFNSKASKARNNVENSKRIIIGMNKSEVISIMGVPDYKQLAFENSIDSMYYYEPPFAASEGIYIQFDIKENVKKVFLYE